MPDTPARTQVFIVNPASGGRAGEWVLRHLRRSYPAEQVLELRGLDLGRLAAHWHGQPAVLVACGGDGTAAALLDAAYAAHRHQPASPPLPVAVVALGTGNDLARCCGWPASISGPRHLEHHLARLTAAAERPLDRWLLRGPSGERAWFNYCSWGWDARVAWRFHHMRRDFPGLFRSSLANRLGYAALGAQELTGRSLADQVAVDDGSERPLAVPAWARALVATNVPSYAGGRRLAGDIAADDQRFELFALGAGLAFGLGLSGLRRPRRCATGAALRLRLGRPQFMQLDGEPCRAPAGDYALAAGGTVRVLVNDSVASLDKSAP